MRVLRILIGLAVGLGLAGLAPAAAHAAFEPPVVLSATDAAQGRGPSFNAVASADGRSVVFSSEATNLYPPGGGWPGFIPTGGGLFRKNLDTGALELVAPQQLTKGTAGIAVPGRLPAQAVSSVSADGRYVVFTTTMPLASGDTNGLADVYRRDMDVPLGTTGAFTLVSAIDGDSTALSYGSGRFPPSVGSTARVHAVSADGNRVAFQVEAWSNIGSTPSTATAADAPWGQVAVRDIAAQRTILLSTTLAAPHGPAPLTSGRAAASLQISADGSTVAWDTSNAHLQVATDDSTPAARQLLWKRVADGSAPTARYAAGAFDPDDPGCPPGGRPTTNLEPSPCDGPFPVFGNRADESSTPIPSAEVVGMTRDGNTLVVLGNTLRDSTLLASGDFGIRRDLFALDMTPGLSRKAAVTKITAGADSRSAATVTGADLSPDGNWIAFTAVRWAPTLTVPAPIGSFPAAAGTPSVLYVIDRAGGTIEQLSRGYDGSALEQSVRGGAVSDGGRLVAADVGGTTTNVFYGDTNGVGDVVAYRRLTPPPVPPATAPEIAPATASAPLAETKVLAASARSLRGGLVRVTVDTPEGGSIALSATEIPVVRRAGKKAAKAKRISVRLTRIARGPQTIDIDLALLRGYAKHARRRGGLAGVVTVTFKGAAGGAAQQRTLNVRFAQRPLRTTVPTVIPKAAP